MAGRLARLSVWCVVAALPAHALASNERALSVLPHPENTSPERLTERQLRRWRASREPGAGLEVVRLARTLSDDAPPELRYLAMRALAEHRSEHAVIDYLAELAEQPVVGGPGSSTPSQTLTRARALLLLATSDTKRAREVVEDKALGARGLDPEGHRAARDALRSQRIGSALRASLDGLVLPGTTDEEIERRRCAERFLADLPASNPEQGANEARNAASRLGARCVPNGDAHARKPGNSAIEFSPPGLSWNEQDALAGYQKARGKERLLWVARVASTVGVRSAPATTLLVQKWLTAGDTELRSAAARGLGIRGLNAGEMGPRLALACRAIAREEHTEVRQMLALGVLAVTRARRVAADAETLDGDRALLAALAQVEPDPVASALLANEPLLALVFHVERGQFDVEFAAGLLALRQ